MARTAIGLFEDQASANEVAHEIKRIGFDPEEVRVLSEPLDMPVTSVLNTPGTDFALALYRDLQQIGASQAETEAYVQGVRQEATLVFATGSDVQVDTAAEIMNRHKAMRVEELSGLEPDLPSESPESPKFSHHDPTLGRRIPSRGDGARIFVW